MKRLWLAALLYACGPDEDVAGRNLHDIAECGSGFPQDAGVTYVCELGCTLDATQAQGSCVGHNPSVASPRTCSPPSEVDGVRGCCFTSTDFVSNTTSVRFWRCD